MGYVNVELKARCSDHKSIREILKSRNARFIGLDRQIDTYFNARNGRLKLREGDIENSLIYYERSDEKGPKRSDVILFKTKGDPALKEILTKSLGVVVVVDKKREIYFVDNVKFHLDRVEGLGLFVEIEAIDEEGSIGEDKLLEQCHRYLEMFGIKGENLVSNSYGDLFFLAAQFLTP